ncbi:MAG: YgiT-type zinc finger protein [Thermomicrobiales bacterium]|nr:YgiT-type zinc finger protein [Thermomicrobiales bacterium]
MSQPIDPAVLRAKALDVLSQMQQFNATHPAATFTELEDAVEVALTGLRQDLLTQSVQEHALADFRRAEQRPCCPVCGAVLQAIGQEERQVTTQGGVTICIERTRGRCSACGAELFPPG